MITYEEQKKMIAEIKKRPDVKRLKRLGMIYAALGVLTLITFLFAIVFLMLSDRTFRKRERLINQILFMESVKSDREPAENTNPFELEEKPKEDGLFNVKTHEAVTEDKADDRKERVERLVRVSKTFQLLQNIWGALLVAICLIAMFSPLGNLLGIDGFGVSMYDLTIDRIQDGKESLLYAVEQENVYILSAVFLCCTFSAVMVVGAIIYVIVSYIHKDKGEKMIRDCNGILSAPLTRTEIKNTSIGSLIRSILLIGAIFLVCITLAPALVIQELSDVMTVNKQGVFIFGAAVLGLVIVSIVQIAYLCANKKDWELCVAIAIAARKKKF